MADGATDYRRPSWDEYFLEIMDAIAKRGTCERGRSGCVIARDKQIVAAGYVGSPIGEDHCDEIGHLFQERLNKDGSKSKHCVRTVHAEQNAICQAARRGIPVDGATLYCKMTPCPVCAKMIINCGINRVVCAQRYHDGAEAERLFLRAGVALEHVSEEEVQYTGKGDKDKDAKLPQEPVTDSVNVSELSAGLEIKIKKLNDDAIIPDFAYDNDAGMDLYSTEDLELPSGSRAKVSTGLAFEIPKDYVGLIWDRTSVPIKKGLKTVGGVVDSGYRGELFVGMVNVSKSPVEISKGEKIAQMVVQKFFQPKIKLVDELEPSERGENTLGSSDLKKIDPADDFGLEYLPEEGSPVDELDPNIALEKKLNNEGIGEGQDEESRW